MYMSMSRVLLLCVCFAFIKISGYSLCWNLTWTISNKIHGLTIPSVQTLMTISAAMEQCWDKTQSHLMFHILLAIARDGSQGVLKVLCQQKKTTSKIILLYIILGVNSIFVLTKSFCTAKAKPFTEFHEEETISTDGEFWNPLMTFKLVVVFSKSRKVLSNLPSGVLLALNFHFHFQHQTCLFMEICDLLMSDIVSLTLMSG